MLNGLKGNNVKFSSKPPVPRPPPKGKPANCNPLNSKLQNSPYLPSGVQNPNSPVPRRAQSATTVRGQGQNNVSSSSQKPHVLRKQSEPAIKIPPNKIATVKPKIYPAIQKQRQHPRSPDTERSIPESFYSSNVSINREYSQYKNKPRSPNVRPPVPKEVRANSPHEDVIKMMMMMGDVESFEDFVDFDYDFPVEETTTNKSKNSNSPTNNNKPKRRPFSFSSENYQTESFKSLSLDLDVSEQPEAYLKDYNINERGDTFANYSRPRAKGLLLQSQSLSQGGRNSPNSNNISRRSTRERISFSASNTERVCSPSPSPSPEEPQDGSKSPKVSPKSTQSFDQIILSESNTLLHDVVKLCDEIGLDASILEKIKNSSRFNSPEKISKSLNDLQNAAKQQLEFRIVEEELDDISCPSTVRNQSAMESSRFVPQEEENNKNEKLPNTNISDKPSSPPIAQLPGSSRPISASSRRSSLGMDYSDTYSRILSVLKHIEEEERKSFANVEVAVKSPSPDSPLSPNSPHPVSSSKANGSDLPSPSSQQRQFPRNENEPQNANNFPLQNNLTISPRSCSCVSEQCCPSARSIHSVPNGGQKMGMLPFDFPGLGENDMNMRPKITGDAGWENIDEKTKSLFSFLDEIEKSDRDTLFSLKFDQSPRTLGHQNNSTGSFNNTGSHPTMKSSGHSQTMDILIRKGSVELAREVIILERKLDETQHNSNLLEETLINQRELNVRNLKNSERDLKKRLKIQQEEFELALSRHQTFVDQLLAEKRSLQDKCEKVLRDSKESESKYQEQIRSIQEKHLEEIKRIRKIQQNSENVRKQKWVGNKTQEIRDMTVKGLEPEVQRLIQRHQQEMTEMRAWHTDEIRDTEERIQRKHNMQLQEVREQFIREKEDALRREREMANKRLESELKQREDEFESQKRRITNDLNEERERYACDEIKLKDSMQENIRKAQIKGEVEIDSVKQEYDAKIANIDRRHESELKSLKDVYEAQKENWVSNHTKKFEQALADKESEVAEAMRLEKEREIREKEKKLRDEFDKLRMEDEMAVESRIKRLTDKFHGELSELEKSERDLKCRLSQAKADLLVKDEEIFTLKTTLNLKEKSNTELQESNLKMLEERANLTSVIRREFAAQIDTLEEDCRTVKSSVLELQAKQKLELEQHQMEIEKIRNEKETELEKIGLRVKQALLRKEETLQELQKQLEKASYRINHLEELLEQQRKDFVQSISIGNGSTSTSKRKQ